MALARNHLGANAGSSTTAAVTITPTGSAWMIATIENRRSAATASTATCTDDSGVNTWTSVLSGNSGAGPSVRLQKFKCQAAASPGTFTVTATAASASGTAIIIEEYTGCDGDFSNISPVAVNTAGDPSATLPSTPVVTNIVEGAYAGFATSVPAAPTLPSGYTDVVTPVTGGNSVLSVSYNQTTTTTGAWTHAVCTNSAAILLEIKAAAATGAITATLTGPATTVTGTLTGAGDLVATLTGPATTISGTLTGAGVLAASLVGPATILTGALTGTGALVATLAGPATTVSGTLTGAGALAASLVGPATIVTAFMAGTGPLAASMALPATALSGTLIGVGALVATLALPGTVVGGALTGAGGGAVVFRHQRGFVCNVGRLLNV